MTPTGGSVSVATVVGILFAGRKKRAHTETVQVCHFHQVVRLSVWWERVILEKKQVLHDFPNAFCSAVPDCPKIFAGGDRMCDISDCVIVCPLQTVERSGT